MERRLWAAGQVILIADAALIAGLGLATRPGSTDLRGPGGILLAALALFFVPLEIGLRMDRMRERWPFWLATSLVALVWTAALPLILLVAGPELGTPTGLGLAGAGLLGALLVMVGGTGAALAARRHASDGAPGDG